MLIGEPVQIRAGRGEILPEEYIFEWKLGGLPVVGGEVRVAPGSGTMGVEVDAQRPGGCLFGAGYRADAGSRPSLTHAAVYWRFSIYCI